LPPCTEGCASLHVTIWHGPVGAPPGCSLKAAENSVNLAAGRQPLAGRGQMAF
jgi:hypothetical protein